MRCPFCAHEDSQVKDSRPSEDGAAIRRRRQCEACGARFTTFERVQLRDLTVVKKNGDREPFDRDKLARAIGHATRKRDIPTEKIDRLVSGIQRRLETQGDEVKSAEIDRKSTRLNSSHVEISYAVFCLKKKRKKLEKQHAC